MIKLQDVSSVRGRISIKRKPKSESAFWSARAKFMAECKELRSHFARADQTDQLPAKLDEYIYATEEGKVSGGETKNKVR